MELQTEMFGKNSNGTGPDPNVFDMMDPSHRTNPDNNNNKHIKKRKANKRSFGYMGMNFCGSSRGKNINQNNQEKQKTGKETEISILKFYIVKFVEKKPQESMETIEEIKSEVEIAVGDSPLKNETYESLAQEIFESFSGEFSLQNCRLSVMDNEGEMEDSVNELMIEFNSWVRLLII